MDTDVVITLLTITVILLSVVIVAMLSAIIVILVKVNRIARSIDAITHNLASASDWLSPVKLIGQVMELFRK